MAVNHDAQGREVVLRLRGVHFAYRVFATAAKSRKREHGSIVTDVEPTPSVVGGLLRRVGGRFVEINAINGVSLDVHAGERLGIMGTNGAGKSTLLRIMAGIYPPSRGEVHARGSVSAILGQTHGMDPELTGYENIRVRGLFMGLGEDEIRQRAGEIAEYSELGDFLDMPLRVYSPGMRMRLGFSISTCFKPDILLLDEWLTAGDKSFVQKATKRMREFVEAARTFVLVSHSRQLIENTCERMIVLDHGSIIEDGPLERAPGGRGGSGDGADENAQEDQLAEQLLGEQP